MRKTRPEDFDPTYQKKSAKRPAPEVVNMQGVVPIKSTKTANRKINATDPQPYGRTDDHNNRTVVRTDVRTESQQRPTKRHPFEIYTDQLTRLKRLKAMNTLSGHDVSMSSMVREALDTYLNATENRS